MEGSIWTHYSIPKPTKKRKRKVSNEEKKEGESGLDNKHIKAKESEPKPNPFVNQVDTKEKAIHQMDLQLDCYGDVDWYSKINRWLPGHLFWSRWVKLNADDPLRTKINEEYPDFSK